MTDREYIDSLPKLTEEEYKKGCAEVMREQYKTHPYDPECPFCNEEESDV